MGISIFRGQAVFVEGHGYGAIHRYMSPKEVLVRFRGFERVVAVDQLLPVVAIESVARFEERSIELELPRNRDDELEPEPEFNGEEPESAEPDSVEPELQEEFDEEFEEMET